MKKVLLWVREVGFWVREVGLGVREVGRKVCEAGLGVIETLYLAAFAPTSSAANLSSIKRTLGILSAPVKTATE